MLEQPILEAIANNPNFKDKSILTEICEMFVGKPEICKFLKLYGDHCELIDDFVDEQQSPDMVNKLGQLRMEIDCCEYWITHRNYLWVVERLIHNTYFDSVQWEKSNSEWKRQDARSMSHAAYNMLFAVILLEYGYEALEKISLRFREHAHLRSI